METALTYTGTIKRLNLDKGFGFIQPDDPALHDQLNRSGIFFHATQLKNCPMDTLIIGDAVTFESGLGPHGSHRRIPRDGDDGAVMTGAITSLNKSRGFGFISSDGPNPRDYFFHVSALENAQFHELTIGDRVDFDIDEQSAKGPRAAIVAVMK